MGARFVLFLKTYCWRCHFCFQLLLWITPVRHLYHTHLNFHWFFKYFSDGQDRYSTWVNHWRCWSWPLYWCIQCLQWWNFNSDVHWQFIWLWYNKYNWLIKLRFRRIYFKVSNLCLNHTNTLCFTRKPRYNIQILTPVSKLLCLGANTHFFLLGPWIGGQTLDYHRWYKNGYYLFFAWKKSLNGILYELLTSNALEIPERWASGTNLEWLSSQNMLTWLNFEKSCELD